jgi:hypothetical protein
MRRSSGNGHSPPGMREARINYHELEAEQPLD